MAIGGEIPGAWTFISEHVPFRRIGIACALVTAGFAGGLIIGSLVATLLEFFFAKKSILDFAWRIPFIIGGIFGFMAVWLRRWLHETPVFLEMKKMGALKHKFPLKKVLNGHKRAVIIAMILSWLISAGIIVVTLMTPTFLQTIYGYDSFTALSSNLLSMIFLLIGIMITGFLVDSFGSGYFFVMAGIVFGITSFSFYTCAGVSVSALFFLYALMQFSLGWLGAIPYVMVRLFPASVRFSGISFSYNVAYAISGSVTPIIISALLRFQPMAPAWYMLFIALATVAVGVYFIVRDVVFERFPETEEFLTTQGEF